MDTVIAELRAEIEALEQELSAVRTNYVRSGGKNAELSLEVVCLTSTVNKLKVERDEWKQRCQQGGAACVLNEGAIQSFNEKMQSLISSVASHDSLAGEVWRGVYADTIKYIIGYVAYLLSGAPSETESTLAKAPHVAILGRLERLAVMPEKGLSMAMEDTKFALERRQGILKELTELRRIVASVAESAMTAENKLDLVFDYHDQETECLMRLIKKDEEMITDLRVGVGTSYGCNLKEQQEHWKGLYHQQRKQVQDLQSMLAKFYEHRSSSNIELAQGFRQKENMNREEEKEGENLGGALLKFHLEGKALWPKTFKSYAMRWFVCQPAILWARIFSHTIKRIPLLFSNIYTWTTRLFCNFLGVGGMPT